MPEWTYKFGFDATDANGTVHWVEVHEKHTDADFGVGCDSRPKGLYMMTGDSRDPVYRIEKGRYEIPGANGGWPLTSDDPNAP